MDKKHNSQRTPYNKKANKEDVQKAQKKIINYEDKIKELEAKLLRNWMFCYFYYEKYCFDRSPPSWRRASAPTTIFVQLGVRFHNWQLNVVQSVISKTIDRQDVPALMDILWSHLYCFLHFIEEDDPSIDLVNELEDEDDGDQIEVEGVVWDELGFEGEEAEQYDQNGLLNSNQHSLWDVTEFVQ